MFCKILAFRPTSLLILLITYLYSQNLNWPFSQTTHCSFLQQKQKINCLQPPTVARYSPALVRPMEDYGKSIQNISHSFFKKKFPQYTKFNDNNSSINGSIKIKYLGIIIDSKFKLANHINHSIGKANAARYVLFP